MAKQGVQADDVLVSIDGHDTSSMALSQAVQLLKNAKVLDFKRPGATTDVNMEAPEGSAATSAPVEQPLATALAAVAKGSTDDPMQVTSTAAGGASSSAASSSVPAAASSKDPGSVPVSKAATPVSTAPALSKAAIPPAPGLPPAQSPMVKLPPAGAPGSSQVVAPQASPGFTKAGGPVPGGGHVVPPRVVPPRIAGVTGLPPPGSLPDPNDTREELPTDDDKMGWVELLRDGYCTHVRWQNSHAEPPPFHRAMNCAANPGEKVGEGKYPRDALNIQLQLLMAYKQGPPSLAGLGKAPPPPAPKR